MNEYKKSSPRKQPSKRIVFGVAAAAGVAVTAGALTLAGTLPATAAAKPSGHPGGGAAPALIGTVSNLVSDSFTLTATTPKGKDSSDSGSAMKTVTVTTTGTTKYFTATGGSVSDIKAGVCVSADGASSTISAVTVSAATDGSCTAIPSLSAAEPGGGAPGAGEGGGPTGAPAAPQDSSAPAAAPTGSATAPSNGPGNGKSGKRKVITGMVTKVDGTTVTVKTSKGTKRFTVSDDTTYRDVVAASQSDITSGATVQVTSSQSKQTKPSKASSSKATAKTVTITTDDTNK